MWAYLFFVFVLALASSIMPSFLTSLRSGPWGPILFTYQTLMMIVFSVILDGLLPFYLTNLTAELENDMSLLAHLIFVKFVLASVVSVLRDYLLLPYLHQSELARNRQEYKNYHRLSSTDKRKFPVLDFDRKLTDFTNGITTVYR